MLGGPPLAARIKELAIRYPTACGTTIREGSYNMYYDRVNGPPAGLPTSLSCSTLLRGCAKCAANLGPAARPARCRNGHKTAATISSLMLSTHAVMALEATNCLRPFS